MQKYFHNDFVNVCKCLTKNIVYIYKYPLIKYTEQFIQKLSSICINILAVIIINIIKLEAHETAAEIAKTFGN